MTALYKRIAILVLLVAIAQPRIAAAWTNHIDCEGGTLGSNVQQGGPNEFTSAFSNTVYSNTTVQTGSQSCKLGVAAGTTGWGTWGAIYDFPGNLAVGSQLWIRVSLYVPPGFDYTANPWLKFMRVRTASPSSQDQGYLDLYINPPTGTIWDGDTGQNVAAPYMFLYEGAAVVHPFGSRPTDDIAFGKWETYEIYYKLDDVSKQAGGTAEVRIWKNNQLMTDLTNQITLKDASTYANAFYLFTWWNGNAPATQSLYVDDITITTDRPSNLDAKGNPCICSPVMNVEPSPPLNVSVQWWW
jgi:hypothetical protein